MNAKTITGQEFTCPKCGGHHFGSVTEKRDDGSTWKTHEVCHDQKDVGCRYRVEKLVMIAEPKK
jgi:hypothetical protein